MFLMLELMVDSASNNRIGNIMGILAAQPMVTVYVSSASALRYLIPPDLNKLGAAFVEGHIRVKGRCKNCSGLRKVW